MNKAVKVDFDRVEVTETYAPTMIYITFHTDGEPDELFTVWEVSEDEIKEWFGYRYGLEEFTLETAQEFVNDPELLEVSDEFECGYAPIYGTWYAPLTMEQIENTF